ncbi:MAG: hypothetical protein ABI203_02685 [Mucilaginibacter sp.]
MIKKLILLFSLAFCTNQLFAQHEELDRITDSIVNEGKALYRSEWASWYGTDIFLAKCANKRALSGGYLSYETNDGLTNIFFTKGDNPMVLATISFGKDFNSKNYKLDTVLRKFNEIEDDLYIIRTAALKRSLSDTAFKHYKNTGLNVVPLIQKNIKKVYMLTSLQLDDIVIFGNDYLLNFNEQNEITTIKSLHKNLINVSTKADSGKVIKSAMHTHLPKSGDYIAATDICTLMLYEKFTPWEQYYVISKNDVSIWDCKKNELVILTMAAWKRIGADEESRHPKRNK